MLEVLSSDDMQVCISCANGAVKSSNFESVAEVQSPKKWLAPASVLLWLQTIFSAPVMADDKMARNFVTNKEK